MNISTIFFSEKFLNICIPITIALISFMAILGYKILDPTNIYWLNIVDPKTNFLGWHFFRNSPWSFPIGLNPNYGLQFSSSIIFSDSIPLLAFIFKLASPWLPKIFQYFGIWILICFFLQAWFAWKLLKLITNDLLILTLGTCFFIFSPPMLYRLSMEMQGQYNMHFSLVTHSLILAGLYLSFVPHLKRRILSWGVLLGASALIHPYFLLMNLFMWMADLLKKKNVIPEFFSLNAFLIFLCWQIGYFSVGNQTGALGFGFYRMHIFSLFDPHGWSYFLPNLSQSGGNYEGFNYFGLGSIILLFLAILTFFTRISDFNAIKRLFKKYKSLFFSLIFMTLFALSNNIDGLSLGIFHYELPGFILNLASIFRSSGRFFWPVFYCILIASLFMLIRHYRRNQIIMILSFALCLQMIDTSAGWARTHQRLMLTNNSHWPSLLHDPFWGKASQKYSKISVIPFEDATRNWADFAFYAAMNGLSTSVTYSARPKESEYKKENMKLMHQLRSGELSQTEATFYVFNDIMLKSKLSFDRKCDFLGEVDGFHILAPRWFCNSQ